MHDTSYVVQFYDIEWLKCVNACMECRHNTYLFKLSLAKPPGSQPFQPLSSSAPPEADLSVSSRSEFLVACKYLIQKSWQYMVVKNVYPLAVG